MIRAIAIGGMFLASTLWCACAATGNERSTYGEHSSASSADVMAVKNTCCTAPDTESPAVTTPPSATALGTPFARVYLAMKGCTSCAACRAAIRQMAAGQVEGGETTLEDDHLEISYQTPTEIPLAAVIDRIATNRLHDLNVVDVLFEARGSIRRATDGSTVFALEGTSQSFALALGSVQVPESSTITLTARVTGWRERGRALALEATGVRSE